MLMRWPPHPAAGDTPKLPQDVETQALVAKDVTDDE
jgi:hypothetical protein